MLGGSQPQSARVVPARRLTGRRAAMPGGRLGMLPREEVPGSESHRGGGLLRPGAWLAALRRPGRTGRVPRRVWLIKMVRTRVATAGWRECRVWRASGRCVALMTAVHSRSGAGTQRAKPRANGHRRRAPSGHGQPVPPQAEGTSGDAQRRPATGDARLTSEGPVVRTHLRPLVYAGQRPL